MATRTGSIPISSSSLLHRPGPQGRHEPRPGEEARFHDPRNDRRLPHARGQDRWRWMAVLSIGEHGNLSRPTTRARSSIRAGVSSRKSPPSLKQARRRSPSSTTSTWLRRGTMRKWMYDRARAAIRPVPGRVRRVPVTWRKPDLVLPQGCEITGAVQIGYGPFEGYGFHALEGLQCMVERRKGGETGVKRRDLSHRRRGCGRRSTNKRGLRRCWKRA